MMANPDKDKVVRDNLAKAREELRLVNEAREQKLKTPIEFGKRGK